MVCCPHNLRRTGRTVGFAALLSTMMSAAFAQSSCSSDGARQPVGLLERFISADCEGCWKDPKTPTARKGELALDWIVPGMRGGDAPLAAAASRDGLARLTWLNQKSPVQSDSSRRQRLGSDRRLRVAHGLPFNRYIGVSIELKPGHGGPWNAWLLLVETVPAGVEGSPVERNLVRNVLQTSWAESGSLSNKEQGRRLESRPMRIAEGVDPSRVRVVGWVEDSRGRIKAIAQSRCAPAGAKG